MGWKLSIKLPSSFSFEHTVKSHGWYDLKPFELSADGDSLYYVFRDRTTNKVASGNIKYNGEKVTINIAGEIDRNAVKRDISHILRLDDDLEEFYALVKSVPGIGWASSRGAGRLLRSATVFEDLVKTICTTNCSWGLTRIMTANLVELLGEPAEDGRRAFPTPEAMASLSEEKYRTEVRAGYRAPYLSLLAESVASGKLDPEAWLDREIPAADLKKSLRSVKGIGDYAAENMLKLLGRYDGLALDSWLRAQYYKKHNAGKKCADRKIERHYEKYGNWKGLAIWCDLTENWFSDD